MVPIQEHTLATTASSSSQTPYALLKIVSHSSIISRLLDIDYPPFNLSILAIVFIHLPNFVAAWPHGIEERVSSAVAYCWRAACILIHGIISLPAIFSTTSTAIIWIPTGTREKSRYMCRHRLPWNSRCLLLQVFTSFNPTHYTILGPGVAARFLRRALQLAYVFAGIFSSLHFICKMTVCLHDRQQYFFANTLGAGHMHGDWIFAPGIDMCGRQRLSDGGYLPGVPT